MNDGFLQWHGCTVIILISTDTKTNGQTLDLLIKTAGANTLVWPSFIWSLLLQQFATWVTSELSSGLNDKVCSVASPCVSSVTLLRTGQFNETIGWSEKSPSRSWSSNLRAWLVDFRMFLLCSQMDWHCHRSPTLWLYLSHNERERDRQNHFFVDGLKKNFHRRTLG